jgi:hypothetical protein
MLPDCSRTQQTLLRTLSLVNDYQSDLEIQDDPCAFYEVLLVIEP